MNIFSAFYTYFWDVFLGEQSKKETKQRRKTAKTNKGRKIKDRETHSTTLWGAPIFSEVLKKKTPTDNNRGSVAFQMCKWIAAPFKWGWFQFVNGHSCLALADYPQIHW